jgi:hypothetical protein
MSENQHKRDIQYSSGLGQPWEEDDDLTEEIEAREKFKQDRQAQTAPGNIAETFYGRKLDWYKEVVVWPMFILLVVEIGIRVLDRNYLNLLNKEILDYFIYVVRIILFAYLAISAVKKYQASQAQVIFAAVLGGVVTGFLLAVFQLFWYFELWTIFNIIGQPLLMAVMGVVIAWLTTFICNFKQFKK